jgi:hypothetical protein
VQTFAVTWDYRCPFARNAHEHILAGLADGADWDVRFVPFSLSQAHVADGETDVWDEPERDSGLLALRVGVVVRDWYPERFPAVHRALFALRHDQGQSLRDETLLRGVLTDAGVDADAVFDEIATGKPLALVKAEHTDAVRTNEVWGVPTFVVGDQAAFVRLMNRPDGDGVVGREAIERVLHLLTWPELNEFKHTSIPR